MRHRPNYQELVGHRIMYEKDWWVVERVPHVRRVGLVLRRRRVSSGYSAYEYDVQFGADGPTVTLQHHDIWLASKRHVAWAEGLTESFPPDAATEDLPQ